MSGYLIKYGNRYIANTEHPKFSPISAVLDKQKNADDSFKFTLPRNHPYLLLPSERGSIVRVSDETGTIFAGDIVSISVDNEGNREFTCGGALNWLNYTLVYNQSSDKATTENEYFKKIITSHNSINTVRVLKAGRCSEYGSFTPIAYPDEYKTNYDLLQDLLNDCGAGVWVDYELNDIVLNMAYYKWNRRTIDVSSNDLLTDFSYDIDASNVSTRIFAVGQNGIRVGPVNDGKNYVLSKSNIVYGHLSSVVSYDNIDDEEKLLTDVKRTADSVGNAEISVNATISNQYGHDAVRVGDVVNVYSPALLDPIKTECVGVNIDLINPANSTATLGANPKTLTGIVNSKK